MCGRKTLSKDITSIIEELNIPTGAPLVYELNSNLDPIKSYYLGREEELKTRADEVAAQGSAN